MNKYRSNGYKKYRLDHTLMFSNTLTAHCDAFSICEKEALEENNSTFERVSGNGQRYQNLS